MAIWLLQGGLHSTPAHIHSTEFFYNSALEYTIPGQHRGGAISASGPNIHLNLQNCNFTKNLAFHEGGAISFTRLGEAGGVTAEVSETLFDRNAARWGGAMNVQVSPSSAASQ